MQPRIVLIDKPERDVRMRKCHMLQHGTDISRLRGRRLQKFQSGRGIVKEVSHQDRGSLRAAHFFQGFFLPALDHITASHQRFPGLGDQFHLRD